MIGGNTTVQIQINNGYAKNKIGEKEKAWETTDSLTGWIDLSSGESTYTTFNTKMQESTHIFICDYAELDERIKAENSRVIDDNGLIYDVMLIDDPMGMHKQLEIYLKYTGGQVSAS